VAQRERVGEEELRVVLGSDELTERLIAGLDQARARAWIEYQTDMDKAGIPGRAISRLWNGVPFSEIPEDEFECILGVVRSICG